MSINKTNLFKNNHNSFLKYLWPILIRNLLVRSRNRRDSWRNVSTAEATALVESHRISRQMSYSPASSKILKITTITFFSEPRYKKFLALRTRLSRYASTVTKIIVNSRFYNCLPTLKYYLLLQYCQYYNSIIRQ